MLQLQTPNRILEPLPARPLLERRDQIGIAPVTVTRRAFSRGGILTTKQVQIRVLI